MLSRFVGGRLVLLLGTLALLAAACGSGGQPQGQTPGGPQPARETTPAGPVPLGTQPGEQAPDFEVSTTEGETFRLSEHRGRVVVIDFLAPG